MTPRGKTPPKPVTINGQAVHPSVTIERVVDGVHREMETLDNPGFCIACGEDADGCEPDAERYECECCGERQVYGAAELLMYLPYEPDPTTNR